MTTGRKSHHPVASIFLDRWSPRAFDGSIMPDADLMTIFEAARWAPSSFNYQPWRFCYAKREDEAWERFLDLLIPFNRSWAHSASVLIYLLSDTQMELAPGQPMPAGRSRRWSCRRSTSHRRGRWPLPWASRSGTGAPTASKACEMPSPVSRVSSADTRMSRG